MDLREFYLENVSEQEYYYKFYDFINDINKTYNIFDVIEVTNKYEFCVYDIDEAIEKFRYLCQPENECHNNENKCWFYLILFYLNKCGYIIEEFPRVVERPPLDTYDFVNKQIRNKLIAEGRDDNGKVRHAERRMFVASLTFIHIDGHIEIDDAIEKRFKEISNRQASFQNMSIDEKLAEIANLIEYMLKEKGNFLSLDYSQICFDYINDDMIKKYRHQLQCFRHSSPEAITERSSFTEGQKMFLIDLGLTILKVIHSLRSTIS